VVGALLLYSREVRNKTRVQWATWWTGLYSIG
jgi:hypothetical protein